MCLAAVAIQKIIQVTNAAATIDSTPPSSSWVWNVSCRDCSPSPTVRPTLSSTATPTPSQIQRSWWRRSDFTR